MPENKIKYYYSIHHFLSNLPNVRLNFGPVTDPKTHPLEQVYIHNIFKKLIQWPFFQSFNFFIIGSNSEWDFKIDHQSVVFYLSNEDHSIPEKLLNAKAIFTPYCPTENCPVNCFPIPLGYNGSLSNNLTFKEIIKRDYDVFFSGNIHRRRLPFYFNIQKYLLINRVRKSLRIKPYFENKIKLTRSFGGGLSPEAYSNNLINSKIALVPEGYMSNNSFRFFEACKYGNVIITKKLYNYWFYETFPGIQINSWNDLTSIIHELLKNSGEINQIQTRTINYYENYCSENAVSKYVINTLL